MPHRHIEILGIQIGENTADSTSNPTFYVWKHKVGCIVLSTGEDRSYISLYDFEPSKTVILTALLTIVLLTAYIIA